MKSPWKLAIASGLAVALALSVAACAGPPAEDDTPTSIRIGVPTGRMTGSFNLATVAFSQWPTAAVYESLFKSDSMAETGGFQPNLATGYERSADWKTVTLTLRDDVTFTDGEKFTAHGLKTYLDGLVATEGWGYKTFWDLNSPTFTAVDETTLVITSEKPMAVRDWSYLNVLFNDTPIASPKALDDLEATSDKTFGSGPYIIDSWTPDVQITFVRNEDYWNKEAFPWETVQYVLFSDDIAALNALKSGQIDVTGLPLSLVGEAEEAGFTLNFSDPDDIGNSRLYAVTVLSISDREGTLVPALADKRVRQAMAFAIDREAINESINHGYGRSSSQIWFDGQDEYVEGGDDRYEYDPERAKELMAEAGYADGFDLTILSTPFKGASTYEPALGQYLGDIGIRVTFDTMETGAFFGASTAGTEHPAIIYTEGGSSAMPVFITSDAVFNPFKVQDSFVDDRWAKVGSGPDEVSREAAGELGEYVLDESIVIVLATIPSVWVSAPGYTADATSALYRFGIEED